MKSEHVAATQGAEPVGRVCFVSHRKAPDVEWAANVDISNGAALYTAPQPTAEVERLRAALALAVDHIDMAALRVSHCKDAAAIFSALQSNQAQAGKGD